MRGGIEHLYEKRLAERKAALAAKERTHAAYAWVRVAVFLGGLAILIIGGTSRVNWLLVPIGTFIVLAIAHARLLNSRDRARSAVGFYERGLARVRHQWIGRGRDGLHLLPPSAESHPYAIDLDLFGRGSLFEMLATTRTHAGEETLAGWMLKAASPGEVLTRQEAIRELASNLDLRERIAVLGDEVRLAVHAGLLRRWSTTPIALTGTLVRIALALLVCATATTLVWWIWTGRGVLLLAPLTLIQLVAAAWFKARVAEVIEAVDEPAHDLGLLAELLRALEQEQFESAGLKALQKRIASSGRPASAEIRALSRLVAMLESRSNVLFAIPAGILMWATQWAFAIEAWRARAGTRIPEWLDVIGEFEALLALSGFTAENPDHAFPEFVPHAGGFGHLEAVEIAHPALGPDAVPNTVVLGARKPHRAANQHNQPTGDGEGVAVLIVSGSNMSGKSTLLRAVGANVVLANMGAPVRATAFTLTPLAIGASIRVVDSLTDGRSRFMAEITRLKAITDVAADHPGGLLFLLDEILSGTNSHDRRAGAEALVAGLVRARAIGLVTTHDLALGEIADQLPGLAANVHFVDDLRDGALHFDYTLRPGIVKSSNALALMRSIGIDV